MTCSNCKAEITEGAKFCVNCGYSIPDDPAPVQVPAAPVYAPPAQQTPSQQFYAPPSQQGYVQPAYAQAPVPAAPQDPVSVLAYIGMILLSGIPLLGFIGIIIIAVCSKNKSVKNFCFATIILAVVALIIAIALGGTIAALAGQYASEIRGMY